MGCAVQSLRNVPRTRAPQVQSEMQASTITYAAARLANQDICSKAQRSVSMDGVQTIWSVALRPNAQRTRAQREWRCQNTGRIGIVQRTRVVGILNYIKMQMTRFVVRRLLRNVSHNLHQYVVQVRTDCSLI